MITSSQLHLQSRQWSFWCRFTRLLQGSVFVLVRDIVHAFQAFEGMVKAFAVKNGYDLDSSQQPLKPQEAAPFLTQSLGQGLVNKSSLTHQPVFVSSGAILFVAANTAVSECILKREKNAFCDIRGGVRTYHYLEAAEQDLWIAVKLNIYLYHSYLFSCWP
uniref:Uncharacterized protein n=1 Tax=Lactuca sativa TaxID=4236 RepID=A0A9R1X4U2_LACSA|nr:hypothetical protein LSAT_V11C600311440 [Lactuca sativa]